MGSTSAVSRRAVACHGLQVAAVGLVAHAVTQLGGQLESAANLPRVLSEWFPPGPEHAERALVWALIAAIGAGIFGTIVAWSATWTHVILNRRVTPAAVRASLSLSVCSTSIDPSTVVQRWVLKLQLVEFLHNGLANILGAAGTLLIALGATFVASRPAGWTALGGLAVWGLTCALLTGKVLAASRLAAFLHEEAGRLLRATVALRPEFGRPSLRRFWTARVKPDTERLGHAILVQGTWGSLLFGSLGMIAEAIPLVSLLVAVATGSAAAGIAVYLYVSRLGPPLANLASLLPMLQDQLVSAQRMRDAFSPHWQTPTGDVPVPLTPAYVKLIQAEVELPGDGVVRLPEMTARAGVVTCVIGPSGSGKSTLLRALGGQMPLRAGRFLADGTEIRLDNPAWLESCGLLAQNPELMPGTIADNLDKFPGWKQSTPIASAIGKLLPGVLSGTGTCAGVENPGMSEGQRRAVALLRAVGSDATVLLLDEPVAGVDLDLARELGSVIEYAAMQGRIIVLAVHAHDLERLGFEHPEVIHMPTARSCEVEER